MIGFIVGVCVLCAVGIALLLPALRNPSTPKPKPAARPPSRATRVLVLLLLPGLSIPLYLQLGEPRALLPTAQSTAAPSIDELLQQLEAKLRANPDDPRGWALAGSTYMRLGHFAQAAKAYQTLHQLLGEQPQILAAWANAEYRANGDAFTPALRTRIARALELEPNNPTALWLAGLEAESRGAYSPALLYLRRLLTQLQNDGQEGREVAAAIARIAQKTAQ